MALESHIHRAPTDADICAGLFSVLIGAQTLVPTEAEAASRSGGRVGGGFRKMSTSRWEDKHIITILHNTLPPPSPPPLDSFGVVINRQDQYGTDKFYVQDCPPQDRC